ncbi:serine-type endopeptidase [Spatholobus suberectus]|nr:serine-type endopeptidase [Spatholobus suberectus]
MDRSIFYFHRLVSSFLIFTLFLNAVHASKSATLYTWEHILTVLCLHLLTLKLPHILIMIYWVQSWEAMKRPKKQLFIHIINTVNGFAAALEEEEVADIAKNPNVVSVFLSKEHKLHTTRSWEFLGLQRNGMNSAWQKGRFGENTIIGNIDTGVWPESKSFTDKGIGPVPAKWRGGNVCQINKLRGTKKVPCNSRLCKAGTLDPRKVNGKIVSCLREGKIKSVAEGQEALSAGATGMILGNQKQNGNTLLAEPHVLSTVNYPQSHKRTTPGRFDITATDPTINSNTTIRMSTARTLLGRKPAPVMASFSSRGPNKIQPSILKPDVTAPGVNILAAYSLFASASNLPSDPRRGFPFNVLQGTSMSCPHVAGIAGLLKTLHPDWSPAAIKSAIMTTARIIKSYKMMMKKKLALFLSFTLLMKKKLALLLKMMMMKKKLACFIP